MRGATRSETCFCCWVHAARPAGGRALASAARAWDVRTPTNTTCLGGCACVRGSARADGAGEGRARADAEPRVARAPRRRRGRGLGRSRRGGRRRGGRGGGQRPAGRALADEAAHFPFDYAGVRAALGAARAPPAGRLPVRRLVPAAAPEALLRAGDRPRRAEHDGRGPGGGGGGGGAARAPTCSSRLGRRLTRDVAFVRGRPRRGRGVPRDVQLRLQPRGAQLYYDTNARLGAAGRRSGLGGARHAGVAHHMVLRATSWRRSRPPWRRAATRRSTPRSSAARRVSRRTRAATHSRVPAHFRFARRFRPACACASSTGPTPGPRAVAACGADGWPAAALRTLGHATEAVEIDRAAGYDFAAYHSYAKRRPCVYGPAADAADGGACFGGGCTRACFKSRIDERFKRRDRAATAPRLCAAR